MRKPKNRPHSNNCWGNEELISEKEEKMKKSLRQKIRDKEILLTKMFNIEIGELALLISGIVFFIVALYLPTNYMNVEKNITAMKKEIATSTEKIKEYTKDPEKTLPQACYLDPDFGFKICGDIVGENPTSFMVAFSKYGAAEIPKELSFKILSPEEISERIYKLENPPAERSIKKKGWLW